MKIIDYDKLKFTSLKYGVDIIHFKYDGEFCYDYQIQSILTKEQFESMKYSLGEE